MTTTFDAAQYKATTRVQWRTAVKAITRGEQRPGPRSSSSPGLSKVARDSSDRASWPSPSA